MPIGFVSAGEFPSTAIILVNWNGWRHTLPCLDSLRKLHHQGFAVVVVDNGSTDESVERIRNWCQSQGVLLTDVDSNEDLSVQIPLSEFPLIMVRSDKNRGFSGGNNLGIRYARKLGVRYVWLLNNDTLVEPSSLSLLQASAAEESDRALVSSTITYVEPSEKYWFQGGLFCPWTATTKHVNPELFQTRYYRYLTGCALLIPVRVLDEVGLLDESIFLYAEDVDYSIRAVRAGVKLRVVSDSIVAHAVSASAIPGSPRAYREHVRNLVIVMRRYFGNRILWGIIPYHVIKVALLMVVRRRNLAVARAYVTGLLEGIGSPMVDGADAR